MNQQKQRIFLLYDASGTRTKFDVAQESALRHWHLEFDEPSDAHLRLFNALKPLCELYDGDSVIGLVRLMVLMHQTPKPND